MYKRENFVTSDWAGGKTTQLFISPEQADFSKRQFDFRISTATIEVEESDFTILPGFERKLMVLEGEITIEHVGHHTALLNPFEQDHFLGNWQTNSKGKVVDFNVIYRPEIEIELSHKALKAGEEYCFNTTNTIFLYLFKGAGSMESFYLSDGDLMEITGSKNSAFTAKEKCDIVLVEWNKRI